jgi:ATP-dependent Lon protease
MDVLVGPKRPEKEKILPLVPLRDTVIFPHTHIPLTFGRPKSNAAVSASFKADKFICFVAQKEARTELPGKEDFYSVGTLAIIEQVIPAEGSVHALVHGLSRVEIREIVSAEPFFVAKVVEMPEILEETDETKALAKHLTEQVQKAFNLGKSIDVGLLMRILSGIPMVDLVDEVASVLELKGEEKQALLETFSVKERLEKVASHLSYEIKILELESSIASKTQARFDKGMKEAVLRERKRTIEKELGVLSGEEEDEKEIRELREKIKKAQMPELVLKKANEELDRLRRMSPNNPETGYIRTYLDWLVAMPWSVKTPNNVDLKTAEKILNEDHYGLEKIKERIIEYLAVLKLKGRKKKPSKTEDKGGPTILCFIGPPGVGKTSIGKSIARALGRKFVRVSLGGVRDEAEIRGHRRTYVGALPGRIIQGVKTAGTKNPVFMLDEIDKIGVDFRGDPSSALLEALDPEQNREFSDHYLEVPFDLSEVFFITTGNMLDTIPPALKDRFEVIRFPGYTEDEKYHIASKFLWKKELVANSLNEDFAISKEAIMEIIRRYTREAGVRELERNLASICRKIARKVAEGKKVTKKVDLKEIKNFLGPYKFSTTLAEKKDEVGMSTGLAWTEAGGDVLFIEVALMPGKGALLLTGQLGEVMKESCQAAMSFIKSHWQQSGLREDFAKKIDVHVHVPEGAVPKDGPSAGVAIATAMVSALTKEPVRRNVAMTGEITLRGRVLEIGGVKEKVIAAHRAGMKTVVLPKDNKKDLIEVPKEIKKDIKFVFASELDQVLKEAIKPASK